MAVSPMDSHADLEVQQNYRVQDHHSSFHDPARDDTSIRIRDEQHQSISNVNSSSRGGHESPLEIRFNKGKYAQNPSTITLGQ